MPTHDALDSISYAFETTAETIRDRSSMTINDWIIAMSQFSSKLNSEYAVYCECVADEHDVQTEMSFEDAMKFDEGG